MAAPLSRTVATLIGLVAAGSLVAGASAMVVPHSFYTAVAAFPPYNRHLIHDIGAFQLGLGSCLALGLFVNDALLTVLIGNGVAADAHAVSHVLDRHLGGQPSEPLTVGVLGLLLTVLALARWHHTRGSFRAADVASEASTR